MRTVQEVQADLAALQEETNQASLKIQANSAKRAELAAELRTAISTEQSERTVTAVEQAAKSLAEMKAEAAEVIAELKAAMADATTE